MAGGAGAEDPPEVRLPEVIVPLPRAEVAADPTASATIVSAETFEGEAKDVAALVATAPGVAIQEYGGLGQLATVSIRGSTADGVLVLLDGIPLNTAFGGGVDLSSIPRSWVGRIEVVRGVEGAAYHAGALGGVVNVVTDSAHAGAWSAEGTGGSFETWLASVEGAARAGAWTLFVNAGGDLTSGEYPFTFDRGDGSGAVEVERTNNGAARAGVLAKVGGPAAGGRMDALLEVSAGTREIPAQAPQLDRAVDDWQRDGRALLGARWIRPGIGPGLDLTGRAHLRADRLDVEVAPVPLTHQRGLAGALEGEVAIAHRAGALHLGVSAGGEAVEADGLGETRSRGAFGGVVADDLTLAGGRLLLSPALRLDAIGSYFGASWKVGGIWRAGGPFAVRASAGRSFRAPSFAELYLRQGTVDPNPELVPEQGLGADASFGYDGPLGLASVGAHATWYEDIVVYEPAGPEGRLRPRNVGEALLAGLEAEVATAPVRALAGLSVSTAYTFLATENLRAPEQELGKELPHRPRHRLYARAAISPGPVDLHVEAHYVGAQWEDARNVNAIDAVLGWNAGASLRLGRDPVVRVSLEVRNLADDRTLQDPFGNPLPGRMALVTVRVAHPARGTP
jgi:iron complex outermembrane receptor protein